MDCANRSALVCKPREFAGQLVTILSSLMPCAIAGAGKLPQPATAAAAPNSISRRRVLITFSPGRGEGPADCPALDFKALSPPKSRRRALKGRYTLPNRLTSSRGVGKRLLVAFFGISAFSALVAGAAIYAFYEVGRSLTLIDRRVDPILASLEVSRSVERIVTASSALSAVTTEQQREQVFAGLSRESAKLQSFLGELRDGGISQHRLAPIEDNAIQLDANLTALDADVRLRLQLIGRIKDLMRGVFDTNEETQRLLGHTLLVYDSQITRLASLFGTGVGRDDPAQEAVRPLIAGLLSERPVQRLQQQASEAADALAQASVSEQKQRLLILAFQLKRMVGELEKGSEVLGPKLRPLFLTEIDKLKTLVDGPDSIPQLRQNELNLIADAGRLLAENANLSNQLTAAAERLVGKAKEEVRAATGSALRRPADQHPGDRRAGRAQPRRLDPDRLALCRPQHPRAFEPAGRRHAGDRRRRPRHPGPGHRP